MTLGTTLLPTARDSHTNGSPAGFSQLGNMLQTAMTADHTSSQTTINVTSNVGFPTAGYLSIGRRGAVEIVSYTGVSGTTQFTGVTRGAQGTTARTHLVGSIVASVFTASHHNDIAAAVEALELYSVLKIAGGTPLAAPAAQIDFAGIPSIFRTLIIEIDARGDTVAASTSIKMRLAATGVSYDTGSNYDRQYFQGFGATPSATEAFAEDSMIIGAIPAASAAAGLSGGGTIKIVNYAAASFNKRVTYDGGRKLGTASGDMARQQNIFFWRNSAIPTAIRLFPAAGNFEVGTVATLYGEP